MLAHIHIPELKIAWISLVKIVTTLTIIKEGFKISQIVLDSDWQTDQNALVHYKTFVRTIWDAPRSLVILFE